ncbi:MAG: cysteine desulfurase family protein [Pseudomonadota bacterium]
MPTELPIYLDYMASTPLDPAVHDVVEAALRDEFANPSSEGHSLGWRARDAVEAARVNVADVLGALPDEIVFTSGATEADNLGVLGAAMAAPAARRRILVSEIEHKAVLEAAQAAEPLGFTVELIGVTSAGVVDLADLKKRLAPDVAVVSVMAVNNETGVVQPVADVAALAAAAGAFVHTDAAQAPAAMAVDVAAWGVDAASFSSHKVYGPKGVGALYLSAVAPWRPRPLMFGGGQEQGLRPGTLPTPLCLGFAAALKSLSAEARGRVGALRDRFEARLRELAPDMIVTGGGIRRHPGALHVRFPGRDASDVLDRLQPAVCAATGSACTSGVIGPSHVLLALGWDPKAAAEGLRFSLGKYTTEDEIERAARAVAEAVANASAYTA